MKIVQLLPYAMDRPGGVQRHVRDLTDWLVAQGHEVRIVAPPMPGARARREGMLCELGRARNFAVHGTVFELSLAGPVALRHCARDLRDWGAELVHLHTPWTPAMVGQLWRRLRLPTVTTIHATLPEVQGRGLIDRFIRRSARRFLTQSAAVVVPSAAPLAMLDLLIPGLKVNILPPAVDLAPWRAAAQARQAGPLRVVFLGRLEARKGVEVLLQAWPEIATILPGATLTIAGDGALRARVEAATGPGLIHAGRPDDSAARALLGAADLFVAPAPYGESYGLVLAEAMAAGAVPVAAANAGYASVLGEGCELLVPPGDSEALVAKIVELAGDRARLDRLRSWAQNRALKSDVARVGARYADLYDAVLSAR